MQELEKLKIMIKDRQRGLEVGLVDVGNFGKLLAQFVVGVGLVGMV